MFVILSYFSVCLSVLRSSNITLYQFENTLTPIPSPKGRGEVLLEPLSENLEWINRR